MSKIIHISRFALAMLLAPIVATFLIPTIYCGWMKLHVWHDCTSAFAGYAWYGLIPASIATVGLGLPFALLAIRIGMATGWHFAIGGAIVGASAAMLLWLLDHNLDFLGLASIAVLTGTVASLVVWAVGVHQNIVPR